VNARLVLSICVTSASGASGFRPASALIVGATQTPKLTQK
jgi:hypothetical protein